MLTQNIKNNFSIYLESTEGDLCSVSSGFGPSTSDPQQNPPPMQSCEVRKFFPLQEVAVKGFIDWPKAVPCY